MPDGGSRLEGHDALSASPIAIPTFVCLSAGVPVCFCVCVLVRLSACVCLFCVSQCLLAPRGQFTLRKPLYEKGTTKKRIRTVKSKLVGRYAHLVERSFKRRQSHVKLVHSLPLLVLSRDDVSSGKDGE